MHQATPRWRGSQSGRSSESSSPLLFSYFSLPFFFYIYIDIFFPVRGQKKKASRKAALRLHTRAFWTKKKKERERAWNSRFLLAPWFLRSRSLAVRLQLCVGPLDGCKASCLLCVLDHGSVTEIILVPRLDAEGTLSAHAPHRLLHVHRGDVLKARETNVQRAEGTWEKELQVEWRMNKTSKEVKRS